VPRPQAEVNRAHEKLNDVQWLSEAVGQWGRRGWRERGLRLLVCGWATGGGGWRVEMSTGSFAYLRPVAPLAFFTLVLDGYALDLHDVKDSVSHRLWLELEHLLKLSARYVVVAVLSRHEAGVGASATCGEQREKGRDTSEGACMVM